MEGQVRQHGIVAGARVTAALMLAAFLLLGLPLLVSAAAPTVVINEIMWDGTEYVELFNTTGGDIELDGWVLTRQRAGGEEKTVVQFDEEDAIEANTYFLIEKKEEATSIAADRITSSLTLMNTGELVRLYDVDEKLADEANTLDDSIVWFAGENTTEGVSMERTEISSDGTDKESWYTSTGSVGGRSGTPGKENSEPAVNTAPEAEVSGTSAALSGEAVTFSAEDSVDVDDDELTYDWSFGDGESGLGMEVTHVYSAAGNYTVRMMVSDGDLEDETELSISITSPVYSDNIVINEFLPNPEGSDTDGEFIELKNIGSSLVDLTDWQLDDIDGGSTPHTIASNTLIGAGAVKSFGRPDTKIALNNSGDTVRLLDPAGKEKSAFTYSSTVPEGQSYNRESASSYVLSTTITAGSNNVITEPVDEEDDADEDDDTAASSSGKVAGESVIAVALVDIREEEVGTMIETEGVVSAPPGVLGDKVLYLAGSGMQIYFYKEEYPKLALGDKVKVRGELTTSLGEYRLKLAQASDIEVVSTVDKPLPHQVMTGEVDESLEGWLVIVEGSVTQTSGGTFYIDDGSGEVKIFIKDSTQIDKPKMKKGVDVTITGVVSRTNSGYRILPRFQEDVRLGRVAGLTSFPATGQQWLWSAIIVGVLGVVMWLARRAGEPLLGALD